MTHQSKRSIVAALTAYSGAGTATPSFSLPGDLSKLSDEDLETLQASAQTEFDDLYGDGVRLSTETVERLRVVTDGIEALSTALAERQTLAMERDATAAEFAKKVKGTDATVKDEDEKNKAQNKKATAAGEEPETFDAETVNLSEDGESLVASGNGRSIVVPLRGRAGKDVAAAARMALSTSTKRDMRDVAILTGQDMGVKAGSGATFDEMAAALDRKLGNYNSTQYTNAARAGREMREVGQFASFRREIPEDLIISSPDPRHVEKVLSFATSESRLSGSNGKRGLLASGGWHAPSEILYNEFLELESRDGIVSIPEIGVTRGGVQITPGPSFQDIFKNLGVPYFHFSEQQDIDGDYAPGSGNGNVEGPKPVYHVDPPAFVDYRLGVDGVIIQSGLLASRGYPEHLARIIRGALVAHDHKVNAGVLAAMAAGSTSVTLPAGQIGAAAPVLSAIELQAEHYKTSSRMSRTATLEGVFPYWIRGAIRSDLSRRLGVDFLNVSDSLIDTWFSDRGIAAQYVYDWQTIDVNTAAQFNQWPTTVSFLLYAAGTWVKGTSDVLTLDTLYDSTLLSQNDFTALFTEEGWFAAKAGVDSRLVTTSISATGATHIGEEIANSGAAS